MGWFSAPQYWLGRFVFERSLAVIYGIGFLVALNQFRPLLGDRGLLPVSSFVRRVRFRDAPSLFQWRYSDRLLVVVSALGLGLAASVVAGLPQSGPLWVSMVVWFVLWALYLSIVNVGQTFYGFGWESALCEVGVLAIFLGPARVAPPLLVVFLVRWMLFRLEFGAGLIKLRGDRCWRDLTCLCFHYETQPVPNPLSWFFHHLPRRVHRLEVLANHVAQLVVPFGLFAPQPVASIAAAIIIVTQCWLILSGNFSWLNVLTITLAFFAISSGVVGHGLIGAPRLVTGPAWYEGLVVALTVVVAWLSYWPVRNLVSRRQRMNASFNSFHFVGSYGAFGHITKERYEIVVEGTRESVVDADTRWAEYEFRAKPGDPTRRPPQLAPYHRRLDWLMWFAALGAPARPAWLETFVGRLLDGDRATLALLRHNPFPDEPPLLVRARLFRYRFTTPAERRSTGAWWSRTLVGELMPPRRRASGSPGSPVSGGPVRPGTARRRRRPARLAGPGRAR